MTIARAEIVIEGVEGFYHCIARCVRRAFLCGKDEYTGRSYEHRKDWVQSRLIHLAGLFGIEVCAYAIMSNHLHVVLRTRPDLVESWPAEETVWRWSRVFPGGKKKSESPDGQSSEIATSIALAPERLSELRTRLSSVSWFMRCLNETIAREANKEDGCKGRFWEGRFKCQALLDEAAVLTCMAYVDLNPIRAGLADRPEHSEYTSVLDRIQSREMRQDCWQAKDPAANHPDLTSDSPVDRQAALLPDHWLCPLDDKKSVDTSGILPLSTDQYLDLVDWTGRQMRLDKPGAIPDRLSPILVRLSVEPSRWVDTVQGYGRRFHRVAGRAASILALAKRIGQRWFGGLNAGRAAFSEA
ncbi:MAG: transposase [Deltaproteobacteria bacterium]|nr:transposase [Deltaproteobacteria bacterium]